MQTAQNLRWSHWLDTYPSLIVPGLRDSDEHHWQTLWQAHLPNSRRIQVDKWEVANLEKWKDAIRSELASLKQPAIVIAHSFGTLASTAIAVEQPEKIAALFLVAPADPDKFGIRHRLPKTPLNKPAKLIASSNDPWLTASKAAYLALQWGADFLQLKNVGHINSDSNLGIWPEGLWELQQLIRKTSRHKTSRHSRKEQSAA